MAATKVKPKKKPAVQPSRVRAAGEMKTATTKPVKAVQPPPTARPCSDEHGAADPEFVVRLLGFVEGEGPAAGLWKQFTDWMIDETMGWSEADIELNTQRIRRAAGMSD